MIIKKELKNATFEYDEDSKVFTLFDNTGSSQSISLNKVYAFAFMRFVVRMAQRNWLRSKKTIDKTAENMLESENVDHPDQMKLL
jgi:hypothetical protein